MAEDSQEMVDEFFDWFEHLKSKFKTKYIGKCIFEIISIQLSISRTLTKEQMNAYEQQGRLALGCAPG